MTTEKLYLGKLKDNTRYTSANGESLYLYKHSWDCEWYWGFGYIGNKNLHCHFKQFIDKPFDFVDAWERTRLTEDDLWVLLDCFTQAYALRKAAEVYHSGGHCTSKAYRNIDPTKEKELNADLEKVLDYIWEYLTKALKRSQTS